MKRLLDLCCCAGGTGKGYALADYTVTGIDIEWQPNYPYNFIQADAIEYVKDHGHEYDVIHASPPCQAYSPLNAYNHKTYPDLIAPIRNVIKATGKPYIIENVAAARLKLIDPIMLCGTMFGLKLYRHRLFETSFPLPQPFDPTHVQRCARNGYLPTADRPFMTITGGKHSKAWLSAAVDAMGVEWMKTIREVCEAIPPAYTQWIADYIK